MRCGASVRMPRVGYLRNTRYLHLCIFFFFLILGYFTLGDVFARSFKIGRRFLYFCGCSLRKFSSPPGIEPMPLEKGPDGDQRLNPLSYVTYVTHTHLCIMNVFFSYSNSKFWIQDRKQIKLADVFTQYQVHLLIDKTLL
jgi:hypothetical protein